MASLNPKNRPFASRFLATVALLGTGATAHAGVPVVVLEPATAAAIPALTPVMLILSCALLAFVGFRALRQAPVARRLLTVTLLASGAGITALQFEPTQALNLGEVFDVNTSDCDAQEITVAIDIPDGPDVLDSPENKINNTCPVDLRIARYDLGCPEEAFNDNGSPPGSIIPAGEERSIGYCEVIIDNRL